MNPQKKFWKILQNASATDYRFVTVTGLHQSKAAYSTDANSNTYFRSRSFTLVHVFELPKSSGLEHFFCRLAKTVGFKQMLT